MTTAMLVAIMFFSAYIWMIVALLRQQNAERASIKESMDKVCAETCRLIVATKEAHEHLNKPLDEKVKVTLDEFLAKHQDKMTERD